MEHVSRILLASLYLFMISHAKRILMPVYDMGSRQLILQTIGEELIRRGHQVDVVIPEGAKPKKEFEQLGGGVYWYKRLTSRLTRQSPEFFQETMKGVFNDDISGGFSLYIEMGDTDCLDIMDNAQLMSTFKANKYDLVIVDHFPLNLCLYLMPRILKVPYVSVSNHYDSLMSGHPFLPSFAPSPIFQFSDHMSFPERLKNFMIFFISHFPKLSPIKSLANYTLIEKYLPDSDKQMTWIEIVSETQLLLSTSGPLGEVPMPTFPHDINIEGLLASPSKPLPKDLETIVNNAKAGVVLVSFGSSLDNLPDHVADKFISAFRQLKETVIWRYKSNHLDSLNLPKNVHVMNWIPQNDILGMKNTKLFITHAGANGMYEAIYHGVPMIAFPVFGDQHHNAFIIQHKQYGLRLSLSSFESDSLLSAINEVVQGGTYKETIQTASGILRNRPLSPVKVAGHAIEEVMTYGSKHLRSHAIDMPRYIYYSFDVIGLLLLCLCFVIALLISVYKCMCKAAQPSKKQKRH